jgi:hypothetical protein
MKGQRSVIVHGVSTPVLPGSGTRAITATRQPGPAARVEQETEDAEHDEYWCRTSRLPAHQAT